MMMMPRAALGGGALAVQQIDRRRLCPGSRVSSPRLRAFKLLEVSEAVQEGVQPSRLAQLRRGQKVAFAAAFAASLLGLAHLVLHVFSNGTRPWWLVRPRHRGVEARVAISRFLSAHPLEYPGLLLASSAVTGACEAAARVNCGRNYRSLYITLAIAGLCYIFDESAVTQQIRAVASTGTGALFIVAYVVYSCLDWLSNGVSISEVFLGVRATRKLGLPQPWKAAETDGASLLLPKLYAIAEGMCLLEMGRSTLWRIGRLLPVLAALDELRRVSSRPEQLSSPEAAQLNQGVGLWAWSALLEAALLGVVCSSWARHLGYTGFGVAFSGITTAAIAAAPAVVALAATFMGWSRSEAALMELTRSRPQQPLKQLGRYDLQKLEGLYLNGITTHYKEFYDRPSNTDPVRPMNDCEYYRIKVRLRKAGSKVLGYKRTDIQKLILQESQGSMVPALEDKLPATRAAVEEESRPPDLETEVVPSKEDSVPSSPVPIIEAQEVAKEVVADVQADDAVAEEPQMKAEEKKEESEEEQEKPEETSQDDAASAPAEAVSTKESQVMEAEVKEEEKEEEQEKSDETPQGDAASTKESQDE